MSMFHANSKVLRHDRKRVGRLQCGRQHAVMGNGQRDSARGAALPKPCVDGPVGGIRYVHDNVTEVEEISRAWRVTRDAVSPPYADHAFHIHAAGTQQGMEGAQRTEH